MQDYRQLCRAVVGTRFIDCIERVTLSKGGLSFHATGGALKFWSDGTGIKCEVGEEGRWWRKTVATNKEPRVSTWLEACVDSSVGMRPNYAPAEKRDGWRGGGAKDGPSCWKHLMRRFGGDRKTMTEPIDVEDKTSRGWEPWNGADRCDEGRRRKQGGSYVESALDNRSTEMQRSEKDIPIRYFDRGVARKKTPPKSKHPELRR
ncbi:hypothetical protein BKA81DRAFT_204595 [Phyllosticta paracitricarpa]